MAKILRHYRITKETDTLIKAEAARLGKSEADIIAMAMVRWCDSVAEMPGIEKLYKPAEEAKTLESAAQVPKAVKKASKKERKIKERAEGDVVAQLAERDDIDYSDVESTPTTNVALTPRAGERGVLIRTKQSFASWRAGRKPLLKPKDR